MARQKHNLYSSHEGILKSILNIIVFHKLRKCYLKEFHRNQKVLCNDDHLLKTAQFCSTNLSYRPWPLGIHSWVGATGKGKLSRELLVKSCG